MFHKIVKYRHVSVISEIRTSYISDRYFEQTRGRVKKVIIGVGETSVDDAQRELIRCYNGCIASVTEDVPHLENWDSLHVSTDVL